MKTTCNFIMALLLLFGNKSYAQYDADCVEENTAYQANESIDYTVYYNWNFVWAKAGTVNFKVTETTVNDESAYYVKAVGKTLQSYEWFYKVKDTYETWIDQATSLPLKFRRDINEGGYKIYQEYTFDNPNNKATIVTSVTNGKEKIKNKTYNLKNCVQDVLSGIYRCRSLDFSNKNKGDKQTMRMFIDGDSYEISIKYMGKENIKTNIGTYRCQKFKASLVKGTLFDGDEELTLWVTDDANHVPMLIEAPIVVGKVKALIKDWSGLRNSSTAKIK